MDKRNLFWAARPCLGQVGQGDSVAYQDEPADQMKQVQQEQQEQQVQLWALQ